MVHSGKRVTPCCPVETKRSTSVSLNYLTAPIATVSAAGDIAASGELPNVTAMMQRGLHSPIALLIALQIALQEAVIWAAGPPNKPIKFKDRGIRTGETPES